MTEENRHVAFICSKGNLDMAYPALVMGWAALGNGIDVTIFFTFWGLQRLRKDASWAMPPAGLDKGPLSKMHMFGLGKKMIEQRMKKANVASLERMMSDFIELGGKVMACDMTMEIMGIRKEDLREDLIGDYCGVGTFMQEARESRVSLFI